MRDSGSHHGVFADESDDFFDHGPYRHSGADNDFPFAHALALPVVGIELEHEPLHFLHQRGAQPVAGDVRVESGHFPAGAGIEQPDAFHPRATNNVATDVPARCSAYHRQVDGWDWSTGIRLGRLWWQKIRFFADWHFELFCVNVPAYPARAGGFIRGAVFSGRRDELCRGFI